MSTQSVYPVRIEADYPERSSRLLALLGILFLKTILLLPHIVVLYFVGIIQFIIVWLAYWVVVFTGRYPRGMFDFVIGASRWSLRVNFWDYGITDKYPPFSLD
jgi:hypothetical protein